MQDPPEEADAFNTIVPLLTAFNTNMTRFYRSSDVICLDECMSVWTNPHTCPINVFVKDKPHPNGQMFRSLADASTKIVIALDVVGLPKHIENERQYVTQHGRMPAAVLRLVDAAGLNQSNCHIVGDAAFAQRSTLLALRRRNIFATFMVKKKQHWPRGIPGNELEAINTLIPKPGNAVAKRMVHEELEYYVVSCQEPLGIRHLMTTCGTTTPVDTETSYYDEQAKRTRTYRQANIMASYNKACHAVDLNNQQRHAYNSIEAGWHTHTWWRRTFAFIFSLADTNAFFAWKGLIHPEMKDLSITLWRLQLFQELYGVRTSPEAPVPAQTSTTLHHLLEYPDHSRIVDGQVIVSDQHSKYPQLRCGGCHGIHSKDCLPRTRLYCSCNKAAPMCRACHNYHIDMILDQVNRRKRKRRRQEAELDDD